MFVHPDSPSGATSITAAVAPFPTYRVTAEQRRLHLLKNLSLLRVVFVLSNKAILQHLVQELELLYRSQVLGCALGFDELSTRCIIRYSHGLQSWHGRTLPISLHLLKPHISSLGGLLL